MRVLPLLIGALALVARASDDVTRRRATWVLVREAGSLRLLRRRPPNVAATHNSSAAAAPYAAVAVITADDAAADLSRQQF